MCRKQLDEMAVDITRFRIEGLPKRKVKRAIEQLTERHAFNRLDTLPETRDDGEVALEVPLDEAGVISIGEASCRDRAIPLSPGEDQAINERRPSREARPDKWRDLTPTNGCRDYRHLRNEQLL